MLHKNIRFQTATAVGAKMVHRSHLTKIILITAVAVIILLNLYTFIIAYPETYTIDARHKHFRHPVGKRFFSLLHGRLETLE